ncbi:MAG: diguanylate cyclase [Myxococcales bacterium]|nr:diguanylate cyclase [Myxococcales bacterium]
MQGEDDFEETMTIVGERSALSFVPTRRDRAYVVVIAGPNVGEMFRLERTCEIGRGKGQGIRLMDTEVSRHHARFEVANGAVYVDDLGSTNGTLVNGAPADHQELCDGDTIQVGTTTILKFSYHDQLEETFQKQMYDSALRDALTGAFNKKYLLDRLETELAYTARHGTPLALIIFDIDFFKRVNDTHGHQTGDHVLCELSRVVAGTIRQEDVFARYGGEEFVVMSRGIDGQAAAFFADRLRSTIADFPFHHGATALEITISLGVASVPGPAIRTVADFIDAADKALYRAKREGRNRVRVAD